MLPYSLWLSEPHFVYVEIAHTCGVRNLVIDIEHGIFPLDALDRFLAFTKSKGMRVLAKVAGPQPEAIQQALDCGADGVIIPHILDAAHAAEICAVAKFPPRGVRSYFGGRPVNYRRPDSSFYENEDRRIRCYPLIETPTSLEDIEAIAALDVVDGLFPGPSDLCLSSGRGSYRFDEVDQAAIIRCANAARQNGKTWIMPGWTPQERALAVAHGAEEVVVSTQFMLIRTGIENLQRTLQAEGIA
ncbi:host specificity protein [Pusillimonas sp. TS35]|uniref:HpcH/HpaI aldolase family protein n=1 Tax=Paracandidimonas lactea TaxID=2895524 RepID=UPI00136A193C|nr:aldolase/citrate lyase family protein [Paracandidimonas lactea]MYN13936.1 host specificity protein [Pusillimonas sp. TS35]